MWDLLDRVPARHASSNFSDRVLREIRLEADRVPSWRTRLAQLWAPAPLGGLAAACAGIALAWILTSPQVATDASSAAVNPPQHSPAAHAAVAIVTPIAEIQEIAETEVLIAAVDHLDAFSDQDLITLIGF